MASPTDIRKGRHRLPRRPTSFLKCCMCKSKQYGFVPTALATCAAGPTTPSSVPPITSSSCTQPRKARVQLQGSGRDHLIWKPTKAATSSAGAYGEDDCFLVEGNTYTCWWIEPVRSNSPPRSATVIEAPKPCAENAGNVLKPVTISTGITVQVPLFIKKDGVVKISTSDRSTSDGSNRSLKKPPGVWSGGFFAKGDRRRSGQATRSTTRGRGWDAWEQTVGGLEVFHGGIQPLSVMDHHQSFTLFHLRPTLHRSVTPTAGSNLAPSP